MQQASVTRHAKHVNVGGQGQRRTTGEVELVEVIQVARFGSSLQMVVVHIHAKTSEHLIAPQ
jgi:hypothetical protein